MTCAIILPNNENSEIRKSVKLCIQSLEHITSRSLLTTYVTVSSLPPWQRRLCFGSVGLSVCLSVCLSVGYIAQKVTNGLG